MFTVVGLGTPGEEYEKTRHNAGRMVLEYLAKKNKFSDWRLDKKSKSRICQGILGGKKVQFVCPDSFMNNSGSGVKPFIPLAKDREKLVVIYDDIDLSLGRMKISFDRGDGGHNGLASIMKALRSGAFLRFRVGIAPSRKPKGQEKVIDFLMKDFKKDEIKELEKVAKGIGEAIACFVSEGKNKTMSTCNI